jgi:hypothetical protein
MITYSICVGHLITKILIEMAQGHISLSQILVGVNPRERLTQGDEVRHVQDGVGMMVLNH